MRVGLLLLVGGFALLGCGDSGTGTDAGPEDGAEILVCESPTIVCGEVCVEAAVDPENCGRCGNRCPAGGHAQPLCVESLCDLECDPGWYDVDGLPGCEYECEPADPADEACNEIDDDCDGETDEGFDCRAGDTEACTAACGTTGARSCSAECTWLDCAPPAEICNRLDDDCDGIVDNGLREALWDVRLLDTDVTETVISLSITSWSGRAVVSYVAQSGVTGTSEAWAGVVDAAGSIETLPQPLAAGTPAASISSALVSDTLAFVWDTAAGDPPAPDAIALQAVVPADWTSYPLFPDLDGTPGGAHGTPRLTVRPGSNVFYAGWIEAGPPAALGLVRYSNPGAPVPDAAVDMPGVSAPTGLDFAADTAGLLVVWVDDPAGGAERALFARRYNPLLVPSGGVVEVAAVADPEGADPRLARSGDRFGVVWEDQDQLHFAVLEPTGAVAVPAAVLTDGEWPEIVPDDGGGFVVLQVVSDEMRLLQVSADGVMETGPGVGLGTGSWLRRGLTTASDGSILAARVDEAGDVWVSRVSCFGAD